MLRKKVLYKSFLTILFMALMFISFYYCYANNQSSNLNVGVTDTDNPNTDPNKWWRKAWSFYNNAEGVELETNIIEDLKSFIQFVGNMFFVVVTIILGIKYIWGGIESKSKVSESLMTLIVAAIFFYGWTTIEGLFVQGDKLLILEKDYKDTVRNIYSTILYILNFVAVGGVIYIGIRYMLAGAEGRASVKSRGVIIVLGIIMAYATITFLNFVLKFAGV